MESDEEDAEPMVQKHAALFQAPASKQITERAMEAAKSLPQRSSMLLQTNNPAHSLKQWWFSEIYIAPKSTTRLWINSLYQY